MKDVSVDIGVLFPREFLKSFDHRRNDVYRKGKDAWAVHVELILGAVISAYVHFHLHRLRSRRRSTSTRLNDQHVGALAVRSELEWTDAGIVPQSVVLFGLGNFDESRGGSVAEDRTRHAVEFVDILTICFGGDKENLLRHA